MVRPMVARRLRPRPHALFFVEPACLITSSTSEPFRLAEGALLASPEKDAPQKYNPGGRVRGFELGTTPFLTVTVPPFARTWFCAASEYTV